MNRRSLLVLLALLGLACAALYRLVGRSQPALPVEAESAQESARASAQPEAELQAESGAVARSDGSAARLGTPHTPARPALEPGEMRVAGWLRPHSDQPWREACVALCSGPQLLAESRCEPDGGFAVSAAHSERALFVVLAPGFAPRTVELALAPGAELVLEDLDLERGAAIAGRLTSNDKPISRFEVVAIDERALPRLHVSAGELLWNGQGFDWRFTTAESGADGRYSIAGLRAGDYSARVATCRGPLSSLCAADRAPRAVRAPCADVDFVFESSALALRFSSAGQPLAGVDVELASGGWHSTKRSDEQGLAAFQLVPRMDCTLVATKTGYEPLRSPVSSPASGASDSESFEMRAKPLAPQLRFLVTAPRDDLPGQLHVRLLQPGVEAPLRDEWLAYTPASANLGTREFVLANVAPGRCHAVLLPGQPWNLYLEPENFIGTHCPIEYELEIPAQGELVQRVQTQRRAGLRLEFPDENGGFLPAQCTLRDSTGKELAFVLVDPAQGIALPGHELTRMGPTLLYSTLCHGSAHLFVEYDGKLLFNGMCEFRAGLVEPVITTR